MDTSVDVNFIKERCERDACILVADSSKRDLIRYPDPAEFAVDLPDPIRMVYGFDILDASIPSSTYNVGPTSNRLCYAIVSPAMRCSEAEHVLVDWSRQQRQPVLRSQIYALPSFRTQASLSLPPPLYAVARRQHEEPVARQVAGALTASGAVAAPAVTDADAQAWIAAAAADGARPNAFVEVGTGAAEQAPRSAYLESVSPECSWRYHVAVLVPEGRLLGGTPSPSDAPLLSITQRRGAAAALSAALRRAPPAELRELASTPDGHCVAFVEAEHGKSVLESLRAVMLPGLTEQVLQEWSGRRSLPPSVFLIDPTAPSVEAVRAPVTYSADGASAAVRASDVSSSGDGLLPAVRLFSPGASPADVDAWRSVAEATGWWNLAVEVAADSVVRLAVPGAPGLPLHQRPGTHVAELHATRLQPGFYDIDSFLQRFSTANPHLSVEVDPVASRMRLRLGKDLRDAGLGFLVNAAASTVGPVVGLASAPAFLASSPDERLVEHHAEQLLEFPDVATFKRIRYIVLHCKEIEEHVYREGIGASGIGIFKLADVNDVAHLRFDFVSFVRRPFHPISNVTRLTFRLSNTDGTLCDFNGVPAMFIVAVKRYTPLPPGDFGRTYVLNPNYDPDFVSYAVRAMEARRRGVERAMMARGRPGVEEFVREHNAHVRDPGLRPPEAVDFEDHADDDGVDDDFGGQDEEDDGDASARSSFASSIYSGGVGDVDFFR